MRVEIRYPAAKAAIGDRTGWFRSVEAGAMDYKLDHTISWDANEDFRDNVDLLLDRDNCEWIICYDVPSVLPIRGSAL